MGTLCETSPDCSTVLSFYDCLGAPAASMLPFMGPFDLLDLPHRGAFTQLAEEQGGLWLGKATILLPFQQPKIPMTTTAELPE